MNTHICTLSLFAILVPVTLTARAQAATPLGTAVTYQGQLKQNGAPANGNLDMEFRLFDAAALDNQVGTPVTLNGVAVSNGLFTVTLNAGGEFGSNAFDGSARWLQISINGVMLSPRQPLTAAPAALTLRPGAIIAGPPVQNGTSFPATLSIRAEGGSTTFGGGVVGLANPSASQSSTWGAIGIGRTTAVGALGFYDSTSDFGVYGSAGAGPNDFASYFASGKNYFGGAVGIGSTSPTAKLDVAGVIRSSSGGFAFPDGTMQTTAAQGNDPCAICGTPFHHYAFFNAVGATTAEILPVSTEKRLVTSMHLTLEKEGICFVEIVDAQNPPRRLMAFVGATSSGFTNSTDYVDIVLEPRTNADWKDERAPIVVPVGARLQMVGVGSPSVGLAITVTVSGHTTP